jgi:hypothetical protein
MGRAEVEASGRRKAGRSAPGALDSIVWVTRGVGGVQETRDEVRFC